MVHCDKQSHSYLRWPSWLPAAAAGVFLLTISSKIFDATNTLPATPLGHHKDMCHPRAFHVDHSVLVLSCSSAAAQPHAS